MAYGDIAQATLFQNRLGLAAHNVILTSVNMYARDNSIHWELTLIKNNTLILQSHASIFLLLQN